MIVDSMEQLEGPNIPRIIRFSFLTKPFTLEDLDWAVIDSQQ